MADLRPPLPQPFLRTIRIARFPFPEGHWHSNLRPIPIFAIAHDFRLVRYRSLESKKKNFRVFLFILTSDNASGARLKQPSTNQSFPKSHPIGMWNGQDKLTTPLRSERGAGDGEVNQINVSTKENDPTGF